MTAARIAAATAARGGANARVRGNLGETLFGANPSYRDRMVPNPRSERYGSRPQVRQRRR